MKDIVYAFIAEENYAKGIDFLCHFTQRENNQYSYENCTVAEVNGAVVAAINLYDGWNLNNLRRPVVEYVREVYGNELKLEDETGAGEIYIDTLGVHPNCHGLGYGSALLKHVITQTVVDNRQTLGLLVDINNPKARNLYLKLGFKSVGFKTLLCNTLEHLQMKPEVG